MAWHHMTEAVNAANYEDQADFKIIKKKKGGSQFLSFSSGF